VDLSQYIVTQKAGVRELTEHNRSTQHRSC
jgi:hypothetical protein